MPRPRVRTRSAARRAAPGAPARTPRARGSAGRDRRSSAAAPGTASRDLPSSPEARRIALRAPQSSAAARRTARRASGSTRRARRCSRSRGYRRLRSARRASVVGVSSGRRGTGERCHGLREGSRRCSSSSRCPLDTRRVAEMASLVCQRRVSKLGVDVVECASASSSCVATPTPPRKSRTPSHHSPGRRGSRRRSSPAWAAPMTADRHDRRYRSQSARAVDLSEVVARAERRGDLQRVPVHEDDDRLERRGRRPRKGA